MLRVEAAGESEETPTHHHYCDEPHQEGLVHRILYEHIQFEEWEYCTEDDEGDAEDEFLQEATVVEAKSALFQVKVLQESALALADSGASVSLCSEIFWKSTSKILSHPKLTPVRNIILIDFSDTRKNVFRVKSFYL